MVCLISYVIFVSQWVFAVCLMLEDEKCENISLRKLMKLLKQKMRDLQTSLCTDVMHGKTSTVIAVTTPACVGCRFNCPVVRTVDATQCTAAPVSYHFRDCKVLLI